MPSPSSYGACGVGDLDVKSPPLSGRTTTTCSTSTTTTTCSTSTTLRRAVQIQAHSRVKLQLSLVVESVELQLVLCTNSYIYQILHRQLEVKITLFRLRQRLKIPRWHHLLMKSLCTCEINESLIDKIYCRPKSLNSIFRSLLYPTSLNFQISNK